MRSLVFACLMAAPAAAGTVSTLNVIAIDGGAPRAVATASGIFEAPNWTPNQDGFVINQDGRFYHVAMNGAARTPFDTGELKGCWGEHGFSPDGKWFALSCPAAGEHGPDVHVIPAQGGAGKRITQQPVSFFHDWSPDGASIVFTSILSGHEDIYIVSAAGGAPKRLTTEGMNDGGEYAADGKSIYFNSNRSGSMQIWRMRTDGSDATQITDDGFDNWYPHISPDGKWMAVLSYTKGEATGSHPMNKVVTLRLIALTDGKARVLTRLTGGQGTFDSPCWSADSKHISFVSYEERSP
jgi:Tol biopolymer transport system component